MVLYSDLIRRLQNVGFFELSRPVVVKTKSGLIIAKSLCFVEDYNDETSLVLPPKQLIVDCVNDKCEETHLY